MRVSPHIGVLVVGRVHVVSCASSRRYAADVPDFRQSGRRNFELRLVLRRIPRCETECSGIESQGFGAGLVLSSRDAPGWPPRARRCGWSRHRAESLSVRPDPCDRRLHRDRLYGRLLGREGFGVGEDDLGTFTAGDAELRIGGGESLAIQQDVDVGSCRD